MEDDDFLDPAVPKEFIFRQQKVEGPVKVTPEFPALKPKKILNEEKITKEEQVEGIGSVDFKDYEKIGKNKKTAKKMPGKILLGTDGNYYKSVKNKEGIYIWKLFKKK